MLSRKAQPDEYVVLRPRCGLPDRDRGRRENRSASAGHSLAFVPPGNSRGHHAGERPARPAVHAGRTISRPNVRMPHRMRGRTPTSRRWSRGRRRRTATASVATALDVQGQEGRFGRIFRCTTFMVNYLDPRNGPRDVTKLSPHHHDDFEQCSLALEGAYIHDIRWPWTTNMTSLAGGRPRILRFTLHRGDPAAGHPYLPCRRRRGEPAGRYLLPAADGFFRQARLGAQRRRLPAARPQCPEPGTLVSDRG